MKRFRVRAVLAALGILCAAVLIAQESEQEAAADAPVNPTEDAAAPAPWEDPFGIFGIADADGGGTGGDAADDGMSADTAPDPWADPFGTTADTGDAAGDGAAGDGTASDPWADPFGDLFSDESMIDTPEEAGQSGGADAAAAGTGGTAGASSPGDLLVTDAIRIGGNISGGVDAQWSWETPYVSGASIETPDSRTLTPRLRADLVFDARPDPDFRAFVKLRLTSTDGGGGGGGGFQITLTRDSIDEDLPDGWTSVELANGDVQIYDSGGALVTTIPADNFEDEETGETQEEDEGPPPDEPALGQAVSMNLEVYEVFMDFAWRDTLLFRFGKHTIAWGVGYFWSPADVLNLSAIDPEDPTADRQGPLSLKAQYPFGVGHALTLYAVLNAGAAPLDIAVAPRADFYLFNGLDLSIAAYYQRALSPRLISTFGFTLGQVDFFGEAVLAYGSDRVFVSPSNDQSAAGDPPELDLVLDTYERSDEFFFSGTAGFRYLKTFEDDTSFALVGQYYFNGEGYPSQIGGYPSTRVLPAAYRLLLNPGENGLAPDEEDTEAQDPPALDFGSLSNFGRHYAGLVVSVSNIAGKDLSFQTALLMNLTDFSGIVTPGISFDILDRFGFSLSARFTFGPAGGEFTNPAGLFSGDTASTGTFAFTFGTSVRGGRF